MVQFYFDLYLLKPILCLRSYFTPKDKYIVRFMTPHLKKETNKKIFHFGCHPNSKASMKMAVSIIKQSLPNLSAKLVSFLLVTDGF